MATTVTLTAPVPADYANALGLAAGDRQTGDVLQLEHRDALSLVTGGLARFGSDATDGGGGAGGVGGGGVTQVAGRDRNDVSRPIRTDAVGRTKISHAQPDPLSADLVAIGDALLIDLDSLSDVMFFMRGAAHVGFNVIFEYSPDTTTPAGYTPAATPANGNWFPVLAKNVGGAGQPASATGTLTSNAMTSWEVSAPAALRVRARVTARTSGTLTVAGVASTAARPVQLGAFVSGSVNIGTPTVAATGLVKAEDAAAASGDVGVAILGVRQPAAPAAATSAAGDYGWLLVDAEGKLITAAAPADPALTFQSVTTLTTVGPTAARAAQAAGIRTYVTDLTVTNTSATAVRVDILDGATVIWTATVPAGGTVDRSFRTPLRGTAATAVNVATSAAVTDIRVSMTGYSGV